MPQSGIQIALHSQCNEFTLKLCCKNVQIANLKESASAVTRDLSRQSSGEKNTYIDACLNLFLTVWLFLPPCTRMWLYQSKLAGGLGGSVKVNHCAKKLIVWYDQDHRPLPWRQKINIYHSWVCNI